MDTQEEREQKEKRQKQEEEKKLKKETRQQGILNPPGQTLKWKIIADGMLHGFYNNEQLFVIKRGFYQYSTKTVDKELLKIPSFVKEYRSFDFIILRDRLDKMFNKFLKKKGWKK